MVDFSKLSLPSPEEAAHRDAVDRENLFRRDDEARDAASKKRLVITLIHEPEIRMLPSGDRVVMLRGSEEGQTKALSAVYVVPPRVEMDDDAAAAFDRRLRSLGGGDVVSLAGQWSKRVWRDPAGEQRSAWEFKAQHFAEGRVDLDRMLARNRDEIERPPLSNAMAASLQRGQSAGI